LFSPGPACFIAEPLSGNAGGVEIPPGYLKRVYEVTRAAGGVCIADEVQVLKCSMIVIFFDFSG
jgi:4-aminobutyrate aminotransferase-like enzyme